MCDSIAVDMEFGTGAVKITPAHDFNDFEVGTRHGLECINILNDDGTLNANAGKFAGVRRMHARALVKKELAALGLLGETRNNPMKVPICSRSGDIVEPILKPQWWLACQGMADETLRVRARADDTSTDRLAHESRRAQDPSGDVGARVAALAQQLAGLVHLAAAVVGPPLSDLPRLGRGRAGAGQR